MTEPGRSNWQGRYLSQQVTICDVYPSAMAQDSEADLLLPGQARPAFSMCKPSILASSWARIDDSHRFGPQLKLFGVKLAV